LNAFENGWFIRWQQEDWHSKGKPIKHSELWKMLIERLEPHIYTMREGHHDYSNVMDNSIRKELEQWQEALSKNTQTS
jgi:ribonuclease HI